MNVTLQSNRRLAALIIQHRPFFNCKVITLKYSFAPNSPSKRAISSATVFVFCIVRTLAFAVEVVAEVPVLVCAAAAVCVVVARDVLLADELPVLHFVFRIISDKHVDFVQRDFLASNC